MKPGSSQLLLVALCTATLALFVFSTGVESFGAATGGGAHSSNSTSGLSEPPLSLFTRSRFVLRDKCMACHTQDYSLPVYGVIPGLRKLIESEYLAGLRHLNLASEFSAVEGGMGMSEAALAKIERSLDDASMPPPQYVTAYLSAQLTTPERQLLREWIYATREASFATGLAAPQFAHEPVQPMPSKYVERVNLADLEAFLTAALGEKPKPPADPRVVQERRTRKIALGEALFHDPRLSANGAMSCATCHPLDAGGMDNLALSPGVGQNTLTNTPTIFNTAFNFRFFWDGSAATLAEQALGPPVRASEMGPQTWDDILERLAADPHVVKDMNDLYPDGLTAANVGDALAEFQKTLLTPGSRFDRYLMGENEVLNADEKLGYDIFKKARCATCHVGRGVGGQSMEYLNLKKDFFADRSIQPTEEDMGLANFSGRDADKHKFKTPVLRNVAVTGPWFHDGSVVTLDEAIRLMSIYQSGMTLTRSQRKRVAAFLDSLTGMYKGRPVVGKAAPANEPS